MNIMGSDRLYEAAEFLINLLAGTQMPSAEVYRLAKECGIADRTLSRAKPLVGLKSQAVYNAGKMTWVMSVPAEMKGREFRKFKTLQKRRRVASRMEISTDWVSVAVAENIVPKIDIPQRAVSSLGMRVKVGMYEFEVDENFPADKLSNLLRQLVVSDE